MSFEGYYQYIFEDGHTWNRDVYDDYDFFGYEDQNPTCPYCGKGVIWSNIVDETNGSHDEDGKRIDGFVELEVNEQDCCPCCETVLRETFKIPEDKK